VTAMASGRYDGVEIATTNVPDGAQGVRAVRYLRRRELPDPRMLTTLALHRVAAGDRLDLVAARYLGDPIAAWQVADANAVLDPDELTTAEAEGDLLVVPFPGGVP
jgi:hypothetical protein